jgi:transcriptional regulator with XRE-family HTH domain
MSRVGRWEEPGYDEIVAVEAALGVVAVRFENGDQVEVPIAELGLPNDTLFRIEAESGALFAKPPEGREREIDWMAIRASAEPDFAEEMRRRDAEESRRIGRRLRALRENNGITQKDAARLADMAPAQLARIERGESDLRVSTVRALLRAVGGTFAEISGPDAPEVSIKQMAKQSGAPVAVLKRIATRVEPRRVGEVVARGFKWEPGMLLSGRRPDSPPLGVRVAFKTGSASKRKSSPIERLARTVSELSVSSCDEVVGRVPDDPNKIRSQVLEDSNAITLESLMRWAWRNGIVVVPMAGPGFEALSWYAAGRPVVVLKLSRDLEVYWLFTLAHEIGHLGLGHVAEKTGLVEIDEPGRVEGDREEEEANTFARKLLVPESDRLLSEIRDRCEGTAKHQRERFKWEMSKVAKEAGLNPALVGIIAAFALTDIARPRDRWGSAINIAKEQGAARPVARRVFGEKVDLNRLEKFDRALVEAVVLE